MSMLEFPDEVVTRAPVRYVDLPHGAGTLALITLDNGFDHTKPTTFGPHVKASSTWVDMASTRDQPGLKRQGSTTCQPLRSNHAHARVNLIANV